MFKNNFPLLLALIWYTTWPYQMQFLFLLYFSVQYGGHFECSLNYKQLWVQNDYKCLKNNSSCSKLSFDILHDHINYFFKCYQFFNYTYGGHLEFWPNRDFMESVSVVPYPIFWIMIWSMFMQNLALLSRCAWFGQTSDYFSATTSGTLTS